MRTAVGPAQGHSVLVEEAHASGGELGHRANDLDHALDRVVGALATAVARRSANGIVPRHADRIDSASHQSKK
jgi:hypothetical protein